MIKLSLMSVVFVLASFVAASADGQTIGYWRFEEGTNGAAATTILDSSPAANPGVPSGGPLYNADVALSIVGGQSNGSSLQFDGSNDNVLVATDAALDSNTDFTVEFWLRSAGGGSNGQRLLVDKSHGFVDQSGWFFQTGNNNGFIGFGLGNGTSFEAVASQSDLFDDQWHHLAGTYDGNIIEFFVDGASQGTTVAGVYDSNTRDIRFGNAFNNGRFFSGQLDEVRISDRVLQRSEFLMAVPEPASTTLLLMASVLVVSRRKRL